MIAASWSATHPVNTACLALSLGGGPFHREKNMVITHQQILCAACGGQSLHAVMDLPQFPFTGLHSDGAGDRWPVAVDQELLHCSDCGHAQLRNVVNPTVLYDSTYAHRSSSCVSATRVNDFFARFLEELLQGRRFRRALEIGCNDLYLLRRLEPLGDELWGVDPIWSTVPPPMTGRIKAVGCFVEDLNVPRDLGGAPDLVLAVHTLEHVREPAVQLAKLLEAAAPQALFVVEVPSFDNIVRNFRFDQVFHQHLQYFSLASFEAMLGRVGFEYVTHRIRYGLWGGTMLMAFRRAVSGVARDSRRFSALSREQLIRRLSTFQAVLREFMNVVESLQGERIWGYGATQMLPTLAYHMRSDLSFLECIWDDDPLKCGQSFASLKVQVRTPDATTSLQDGNVVVTAPDGARAITRRLLELNARRILLPLPLF